MWKLYKENHYAQYSKENRRVQNDKENISKEAGVDPTNIRTAAELACQLGYYLLRIF